ncbi:MAG: UbiD family decarboxylase, partial [Thermoleophilia bacterium]
MSYYRDFREYIAALEADGLVRRITSSICKDTELMPLVRLQFRGLPAEERTAFVFENVTDKMGRKFDGQVAVGVLGANRAVYAKALGCASDEITERWAEVHKNYIPPRIVDDGPVMEEIHVGADLLEHEGILEFPHPISTPGFDPAPYFTSPFWVTKDPVTGDGNIGTYRVMVKGGDRAGMMAHQSQHIGLHLQSARSQGKMLEAAIIVGCTPAVGLCSVAKIPLGVDEYDVAGAIAGEPIELVKCQTVDLAVPASAEIVIEGYVDPTYREPEAPFGEYTGYMGTRVANPVFHVTGIMHRKKPLYQAFLSQFPPSESSLIRKLAYDAVFLNRLRSANIPGVLDAQLHEATGSYGLLVIQLKKVHPSQPWQALHAAVALDPTIGKMIVAVDDDIDPNDADAVNWAMAYRMRPHLDTHIVTH